MDARAPGNVPGLRALALTRDGRFGVAVGDQGRLAVLHGDATPPYWDTPGAPLSSDLYTAALLLDGGGWVAGDFPALLRYPSLACGVRPAPCWELDTGAPHGGNSLRALVLADAANGWSVGLRGQLYRWDGVAWRAYPDTPTSADLHALTLLTPRLGWAVGDSGTILRYTAP